MAASYLAWATGSSSGFSGGRGILGGGEFIASAEIYVIIRARYVMVRAAGLGNGDRIAQQNRFWPVG